MYDLSLNDQSPKQVGSPLQRSGLPITFVSMVGVELAGPPSWYLLPLRDLTTQYGDFIDELLSLSLQCNEPSFHLEQTSVERLHTLHHLLRHHGESRTRRAAINV